MAIFETDPILGTRKITSVGSALDQLNAFNALYAVQMCDNNPDLCGNKDDTAAWRKLVYDGVINVGGEPMELDFFEKIFGGTTPEVIPAKKKYFRYNNDIDMNVYAQNAVSAAAAGGSATFRLLKSNHTGGGKYSYPAKGMSLYIYEDRQWVMITAKNTDADYGHTFDVKPYNKDYRINIRKGKKMMVSPVNLVSHQLVAPDPTASQESTGYTKHIQPFSIRKDWELPIELMKGYDEVLQWAIMFDENGNEVDAWEPYRKTAARRDMKLAKNLMFYLGQEITNPDLLGTDITADYAGFSGYLPTMRYGGAQLIDFDPGIGFDLEADYEPVIVRNDSLKRTTEYVVLHPLNFKLGLERNANGKFKHNSGACTFETFKRMGVDQSAIMKLGISSYEYAGHTLHFKQQSAMSDSRVLGNYDIKELANFIPGNGLRDSKGREVPSFQFFVNSGQGATGMLEEYDLDHRKIDRTAKLSGYLSETVYMIIHAPHQHILANPYITV